MKANSNPKQKSGKSYSLGGSDMVSNWLIFLILPVIVFYKAVRNFHIPQYRKFIVLFGLLYGITFIPISNSDGERYGQNFKLQKDYSFSQYTYDITHIYDAKTVYPDVYAFSLFYFLGLITNNPQFFYAVTALIYFIVFISLLGVVYDETKAIGNKPIVWFFIGLIFLMNFSSGMNGVRWPLAMMVFLLGSFKLLAKNNIKYLMLAGIAVFIHFAMLYAFFFLIIYYLTLRFYKPVFVYIFLGIALFSSALLTDLIQQNTGFFGEAYQDRVVIYSSNELYKEGRDQHLKNWHWYVQLNLLAKTYYPLIALIVIALVKRKIFFNHTATRIEYFAYLMMGASLISGKLVDTISNRYILIANGITFILLYYLSALNPKNLIFRSLFLFYLPFSILNILVSLRVDLNTISPLLLFGNPLLMLLIQVDESIQTLLLGI
jgi:hypothetical protein